MSNCIVDRLEQIDQKCQVAMPFMLVGKDGIPYTVLGFSRGVFFSSTYFAVVAVHAKSHCAQLEVLAPCCCGKNLFRTKAKIYMNLNCFCGISIVVNPVYDCLQKTTVIKDHVCIPFRLMKDAPPKIIWRTYRNEILHAETISVHYNGTAPELALHLCMGGERRKTLVIPENEFRSITVSDLESIEIATPSEAIHGQIELQLNHFEKNNIYFENVLNGLSPQPRFLAHSM